MVYWDDVVYKQVGYSLVGVWALFGPVLAWILNIFIIPIVLIIFFTGVWEIIDAFVFFYIHYVFKIDPRTKTEDKPKLSAEITKLLNEDVTK